MNRPEVVRRTRNLNDHIKKALGEIEPLRIALGIKSPDWETEDSELSNDLSEVLTGLDMARDAMDCVSALI